MTIVWQGLGVAAIGVGIVAIYAQGTNPKGWLIGLVCQVMWLPAFVEGEQWPAVLNAGVIGLIAVRNYYAMTRALARPTLDMQHTEEAKI